MPSCLIKGCFNTWKQKESKVILHVFPRDKDGIRLWLSQSPENFPNVDELVEKIYSQNAYGTVRLCSKHFNDDQYFHEGTKRRLRPNALPTIFTAESLSPKTVVTKKGTKRKRSAAGADLSNNDGTDEGASSNVLFYAQTSDASNTFVQQVLPSHLQIVLPSTSLLAMEKPKMADKAINTDAFFSRKCQAVGTDPMFGKKSAAMQTKPWKGKSQGTFCNILNADLPKHNQGISQNRVWQNEKNLSTGLGVAGNRYSATTSKMFFEQGANKVVPKQEPEFDTTFPDGDIKPKLTGPFGHNDGSPSTLPMVTSTPVVNKEDPDDGDSETGSSTDNDSEKEDLSTKNTFNNLEGHCDDSTNEANFTVLKSCLYDLIKLVRCQYRNTCHAPLTNVQIKTLGTVIAIDVLCGKGHNSTLWHSQPIKNKPAVGNLLPASGGPQRFKAETFFHNLEYDDDLPE